MIRKLILPALAALLLAGCATYQYRGGTGDYYYGQPGTEYRYYGYPYGGYGYGAYGYGYPSYFSYRSYYSYPYGYGGYYRPPYKPPHHGHGDGHGGSHGGGNGPGQGQNPPPAGNDNQDRPTAPWRDLERLRERARTHDRVRPTRAEPSVAPHRRAVPQATQQSAPVPQRVNPVRERSNPVRARAPEVRSIRKRDRGPTTEL